MWRVGIAITPDGPGEEMIRERTLLMCNMYARVMISSG